jgi:hypothetical protein
MLSSSGTVDQPGNGSGGEFEVTNQYTNLPTGKILLGKLPKLQDCKNYEEWIRQVKLKLDIYKLIPLLQKDLLRPTNNHADYQ